MRTAPANILLIEDNPDHAELTVHGLKNCGLVNKIDVVGDGEKALEYLHGKGDFSNRQKFPLPTLILLDIKLPKVDGLAVLKAVKKDPVLKKIPVIILTTSESDKDIAEAYAEGANSYIAKPISFSKFVDKVGSMGFYWTVTNTLPDI